MQGVISRTSKSLWSSITILLRKYSSQNIFLKQDSPKKN
ncbi:hypothetical protein DU19_0790 [Chlamydia muridarum]|nr:hypothetical protein DU17_0792 [Chlamydia muridarum]KDU81738.1 hypothetical protein DU18_0790 [Chlamydia muridarum]KDU82078.1 hypothetical protein DU19_0790 [Chlamydia muridarum]KDU83693.1 hypothetical protein DU20_0790 [Chlamydia muridarum]KDU84576.1 hypothetical protein DU21_0792 [Chlamydia muridarum]